MTTMLILILGALLIGVTLGLLGSGGSVLTVPVLVYLVGHNAKISIAESMAIVGLIGVVSAVPYARTKQIDWKSVIYFGIPGMIGTFVGAWLGGFSSDAIQLAVFGVVLLLAAGFMIRRAFFSSGQDEADGKIPEPNRNYTISETVKITLEGLAAGVLTGARSQSSVYLESSAVLSVSDSTANSIKQHCSRPLQFFSSSWAA